MRRKCEIIDEVEIVIASKETVNTEELSDNIKTKIITCSQEEFYTTLFETTATEEHLTKVRSAEVRG